MNSFKLISKVTVLELLVAALLKRKLLSSRSLVLWLLTNGVRAKFYDVQMNNSLCKRSIPRLKKQTEKNHTQKGIRKSFKAAWKSTKQMIRLVSFIVLLSGPRQAPQQMEVLILIAPFSFYIAATET